MTNPQFSRGLNEPLPSPTPAPASPSSPPASWERFDAALTRLAPRIIEFRRHLHAHPELSLKELATTTYLAEQLTSEGIPFRFGSGQRGLIVDLGSSSSGGRLALRADCDALPIQETTQAPYASQNPGVMHACGHDAHSAMLLGALIALHQVGCPLPVRGVFQPAEETGDGALGIIADGALEGVAAIVALHVDPNLPAGEAAAVSGTQSASCQDFYITVTGRGGHAARPHLAVDPVAITAALITQIYQAVPRRIDSRKALVVSICQIQAGHATNVIPDTATLAGTIRSLDAVSAQSATETIERIGRGIAESFDAKIAIVFSRRIPGVINDPAVTAACTTAAQDVCGQGSVLTTGPASLGAEDFADYQQLIPGCMLRLGVKRHGQAITPLHTPNFDVDETALLVGARLLVRCLLRLDEARSSAH